MPEETDIQPITKIVPFVWGEPGAPVFANHALIQYDGKSVFVTFGQAAPPLIWGTNQEEKNQQLEKIDSITVWPIIRIALDPESYRGIAEAFQKQLEIMGKSDAPKQQDK